MSQNGLRSAIGELGKLAVTILSGILGVLAGLGLLSWVILFLQDSSNPLLGSTSMVLAPAVAIFGAFGWTGGTALRSSPVLRVKLRRVGIAYTAAALHLVIMGMLLPVIDVADTLTTGYWILAWTYVALTFASAFTFGCGTAMLVYCVFQLWNLSDESQPS